MSDKVKVTIDGISVEVAPGTTIMNAARQIGIYLFFQKKCASPGW
jgi:predicted molibdopterin-dependent oxidoreductase YjgC